MKKKIVILVISFFLFLAAFLIWLNSPSPQNTRITNITDHSVSISWTTQRPTKGWVVSYFSQVADEIKTPSTVHQVTLRNLEPETVYSYKIRSGFWFFAGGKIKTTPSREKQPAPPNPVYGKVVQKDGFSPAFPAIVYLHDLSAIANQKGNWSLDLGENIAEEVEIFCQGGNLGQAKIMVKTEQMRPTPLLILR